MLGRTDVRVSEVTLGTWGLASGSYGPTAPEQLERTVARALDSGVTSFDCAPSWGDDGASERRVGKALGDRRKDVVLITRGGAVVKDGEMRKRFDPESLVRDCEESLVRFGTEVIDLWLLHNPEEMTLRRDDWREAPQKLIAQGKVRSWGVSVSDVAEARIAIAAGAQVIALVYNLLWGDDLHDLAGDVSMAGCGVLARSPLGYGLLAGRWGESHTFAPVDHRSKRWSRASLRQRVRQTEMMRFLVHGEVRTLTAASIRYVLANAVVSSTVVGARTPGQISDAAEAAKGPPYLPDEDLMRIPQVLAASGA